MPLELYRYSERALFSQAKQNHVMDCIECGACAFACPAKLPLTQSIRAAKREIARRKI
jgi:electron transport complex protein RnfC